MPHGLAALTRGTPYRAVRALAEGGMGEIYEVVHETLRRPCAIKVLHERHRDRADLALRLRDEARAVAGLRHPGIVDVFDLGQLADGRPYFAMERLVGSDLRRVVRARGAVEVPRAIDLAVEALDALEAAHDAERVEARAQLHGAALEARLTSIAHDEAADQLEHSAAGRFGKVIEPAIKPLGMDWRVGIGVIGSFAAREVFVSTLGVVFGIGASSDEHSGSLRQHLRDARRADGSHLMTPLSGVALMVFFVLACQCMSTIAVVRRESGSWKWPLLMITYMSLLAYGATLGVYQLGTALGWGTG